MKNLLRIEELFLALLSVFLFSSLDIAWWWFVLLFLAPDLGALGYLIILAHSSFDRILGYGLKHPDSFQHTHLGMIGRRVQP